MTKTSKNARTRSSPVRQSSKSGGVKTNATVPLGSQATTAAAVAKGPNKREQLAALVVRDEGATLNEMIAATGWLPHTTRAALTGLKKKGYVISSDKVNGVRTYRAVAPE